MANMENSDHSRNWPNVSARNTQNFKLPKNPTNREIEFPQKLKTFTVLTCNTVLFRGGEHTQSPRDRGVCVCVFEKLSFSKTLDHYYFTARDNLRQTHVCECVFMRAAVW